MKVLQEIKVSQESVNDKYLSVVSVFFENDDHVDEGDTLIELESSKTVFSIESDVAGYVKYYCNKNDDVAVGSLLIKIFDEIGSELPNYDNIEPEKSVLNKDPVFSKNADQYILENKIDKTKFVHMDFVNLDDVLNVLNINNSLKQISDPIDTFKSNKIEFDKSTVTLYDIKKNKKREIEYLKFIQNENLNSTVFVTIDTEHLFVNVNHNMKYLKNSILPLITFETSKLLIKYPEFNAFYVNDQIAEYKEINIGFAIDMGLGLKILKIPNTETKSIIEIEELILSLSNKYIDNKLDIHDLSDITFTITDLSSEGVNSFIPLINKNNSAIIGISSNDNKLKRITLSLTFDHRVTAGKYAAAFLRELKNRIESYKQFPDIDINTDIKCYKCYKTLKEDFNEIGFIKVVTKNGEEKYICQTCLTGF